VAALRLATTCALSSPRHARVGVASCKLAYAYILEINAI
jgi:hypothetical protein